MLVISNFYSVWTNKGLDNQQITNNWKAPQEKFQILLTNFTLVRNVWKISLKFGTSTPELQLLHAETCQFLNWFIKSLFTSTMSKDKSNTESKEVPPTISTGSLFSFHSYLVAPWDCKSILIQTNRHPSKCTHEIKTIWNMVWKRARKNCNKREKCKRKSFPATQNSSIASYKTVTIKTCFFSATKSLQHKRPASLQSSTINSLSEGKL